MADTPFPTTEAGLNLLLQTLKTKLPGYAATLGLTADEVAAVIADADNFEYLITIAPQVDDAKQAFFEFKDNVINGAPSTVQATPPVLPVIAMPTHPFPGIKKRTQNVIQRAKKAPGYTDTIGEDLGFIDTGEPRDPNLLTAALAVAARSGSRVEVTFSRQGMDAMKIEFRRKGETAWSLATIATASPFMHEADPATPGEPELREYRGTLLQKNEPIGNMSPVYSVVTTP
jgi:hypothetical protein